MVPQLLHNIKFVFFPTHFFPSMKKKNNFLSFFVECLGYIQENCSVIGPTHLVLLDGIKNICWISFAFFLLQYVQSLNETRLQHLTFEMSSSRPWRQITLMSLLDVIEQWHQVHELYSSRLNFKQNQMSWPLCHNYLEKLDTILWKWWINVIINNSCVDALF